MPDNPLAQSVDASFTFHFRSNSALDTNAAVADVRSDRAEIWSALKTPIAAQGAIAQACGLAQDKVKVHVMQGGGSFGRRLFFDAALEAAKISKAMGKPVKLMWHRADDARVGRTHPMATSHVRATYAGDQLLAFQQSHTSVETDFRHGLGEMLTATAADLPAGLGNLGFAESIFLMTTVMPYDFALKNQLLNEVDTRFNTGSMRNIYSPDVRTAGELVVDQLAARMGLDPYQFRKKHLSNDRVRAVLDKVAEVGQWGKAMKPGTAQGIAIHEEYKGATACLVEIDCRPKTVKRKVRDGGHRPPGHQGHLRDRRRAADQPARAGGPDAGRHQRRHRPGADLVAAPAGRALPRGQLGQLLLHAAVEHAAEGAGHRDAADHGRPRRRGRGRRRRLDGRGGVRVRAGDRPRADVLPDQPQGPAALQGEVLRAAHPAVAGQRPEEDLLRRTDRCPSRPSSSTASR